MVLMSDEISRNSKGGTIPVGTGISPPKYRIKRIEYIDHDGDKRFEHLEPPKDVDDIEAFRKKLKGRRYADVFFVYETIWNG